MRQITVAVHCAGAYLRVNDEFITKGAWHIGPWPTEDYTVRYSLDNAGPYRVSVLRHHTPSYVNLFDSNGKYVQMACFLPHDWDGMRVSREVV